MVFLIGFSQYNFSKSQILTNKACLRYLLLTGFFIISIIENLAKVDFNVRSKTFARYYVMLLQQQHFLHVFGFAIYNELIKIYSRANSFVVFIFSIPDNKMPTS